MDPLQNGYWLEHLHLSEASGSALMSMGRLRSQATLADGLLWMDFSLVYRLCLQI